MLVNNKTTNKKKWLLIGLAALVLLGGTVLALDATNVVDIGIINDEQDQTTSDNGINYGPPTEEEAAAGDAIKETLPDENESNNNQNTGGTSSQKRSVTPVIVSASREGVRGFVQGVAEDGGTCTARFTQGSSVITKTSQAFFDVNKTSCSPIDLAAGELGSGAWQVTLVYSSSSSEGTSSGFTIE